MKKNNHTPIARDFSTMIRHLMLDNGERQSDLAPVLGLKSGSGVSDKLRGEREWTLGDIYALAKHYDKPIADFFDPEGIRVAARRGGCIYPPIDSGDESYLLEPAA